MFLQQEALSSLHNGGIRAQEGHRVLLDLITEEQVSPANSHKEIHSTLSTTVLGKLQYKV